MTSTSPNTPLSTPSRRSIGGSVDLIGAPLSGKRLTGALLKQRDHVKSWRPRYFVLHQEDGLLLYYLPATDPRICPPRGAMPVAGCILRRLDDVAAPHGSHAFAIVHPWMRPWFLAAASATERDVWMQALAELLSSPSDFAMVLESSRVPCSSPSAQTETAGDLEALVVADKESRIEEAVRKIQELAALEEGWIPSFEKKGVKAFRRPGQFVSLRGIGVIPYHPIAVMLAASDTMMGPKLDPQLHYARRIRVYNHHNFTDYMRYYGVWPVAPRDMYLHVHFRVLDDGTLILVVFSEEDGLFPPESGVVRADCKVAGWVIKPADAAGSASRCTYISVVDLKGDVPKLILDKATEGQPLLIAEIAMALSNDKEGHYKIDTGKLKGGYNNQDVIPYIHQLHRRNFTDWKQQAPWLADGKRGAALPPSEQAVTDSPPQADPSVLLDLKGDAAKAWDVVYHLVKLLILVSLLLICLWANKDPHRIISNDLIKTARRMLNAS